MAVVKDPDVWRCANPFVAVTDLFLLHEQASVRLAMQNYGRTPAVIKECIVGAMEARYEIGRQAALLDGSGSILQETRHWHEDTGVTTSGREKSDAEDYRYFPEPDLVPVAPARDWVAELKRHLPEPPRVRRARLQQEWGFSDLEMRDTVGAGAFDLVEETIAAGATPQAARKWWLSELARRANELGTELAALPITRKSDLKALQQRDRHV